MRRIFGVLLDHAMIIALAVSLLGSVMAFHVLYSRKIAEYERLTRPRTSNDMSGYEFLVRERFDMARRNSARALEEIRYMESIGQPPTEEQKRKLLDTAYELSDSTQLFQDLVFQELDR